MFIQKSFTKKITSLISLLLLLFIVNGCDSTESDLEARTDFDSGFLATGETFSFTFEQEGTFDYYCRSHSPEMTGQVIVDSDAETTSQDTVTMENSQFNPSQITIALNTTVTWINNEGEGVDDHTVTSGTPGVNGDDDDGIDY
ncbi:MAG: plastocyanin/azurin family copper-binding protein [Balneolaceae bacterium]